MNERIETIILISCLHFDCHPDEFFSKSRTRKSPYARSAAAILIRKHTTLTVTEIAKLMNRTHMTIWSGINRVCVLIDDELNVLLEKYARLG